MLIRSVFLILQFLVRMCHPDCIWFFCACWEDTEEKVMCYRLYDACLLSAWIC